MGVKIKPPLAALVLLALGLSLGAQAGDDPSRDRDVIRYGLDSEIITLLGTLGKEESIKYKDDILLLFRDAGNSALREAVIGYFTAFKDDSLKKDALAALEDPFGEKNSTLNLWFKYIAEIRLKEAAAGLRRILSEGSGEYLDGAVPALGEAGGPGDGAFLLDYMDSNDVTAGQKQALMRAVSKLASPDIAGKLTEIAGDDNENTYVRMYAAEALGSLGDEQYVPLLAGFYDHSDPVFRAGVVRALSSFGDNREAQALVLQAIRDSHYRVRLEAIGAAKKMKLKKAEPYLLARAENDPEAQVKYAAYGALAALGTKEGENFLLGVLRGEKNSDAARTRAAAALLEGGIAVKEVAAAAEATLRDDRQKNLRYSLGKEFARVKNSDLAGICGQYLAHQDAATRGTGLDIFARGRYPGVLDAVKAIGADEKGGTLAAKARRILEEH
ncbi:MAG: HEAT repeat domain-containing protein [Spirochaetaceae bacterium]|jgi:HEAT repeat protein|nr:HEAT repeat domain-containing protein [Spirochaetaceae bacterium]